MNVPWRSRGLFSLGISCAIVVSSISISLRIGRGLLSRIPYQLLLPFGGVNAATIAEGEWWRLVTSQFVHVYPVHAAVNAAAAFLVGRQLERRHGAWTFVGVYLCAGVVGQAAAILTTPDLVATGASQAVMGISAALIILATDRLSKVTAPAFGFIALSIALDLVFAHTVKVPHLAGLVAGVAFASLLSFSRHR